MELNILSERKISASQSLITLTYAQLIESCRNYANESQLAAEIVNDGRAFALLSLTVALVQLIAGIFCIDFFNKTALRQVTDIRIELFKSFMRQEVGWHDVIGSKSNYTVRVTE